MYNLDKYIHTHTVNTHVFYLRENFVETLKWTSNQNYNIWRPACSNDFYNRKKNKCSSTIPEEPVIEREEEKNTTRCSFSSKFKFWLQRK